MRVAVLGGTGGLGEGLLLRWGRDAADLELVVGSRDAERAVASATAYRETLAGRGATADIEGRANSAAVRGADAVVLSVPPDAVVDTLDAVRGALAPGTVLLSPASAMRTEDGDFGADPPSAGSVTELVAAAAPEGVPVAGAYHTLPAGQLADLDRRLRMDVPVVGEPAAVRTAVSLTDAVTGLRPLRAGGVGNAPELEALTPLLLNLARHDERVDEPGVRFES